MPLMEIIHRVNKLSSPIQLTRETGFITVTEYDPVTEQMKTYNIPTWCHTKAYFKLRSGFTQRKQTTPEQTTPKSADVNHKALTTSDGISKSLRNIQQSFDKLTPLEQECVKRFLEGGE